VKPSSLLQHIGIAIVLISLVALNDLVLRYFFTGLFSTKIAIALTVGLYLAFIIQQSHVTAGRITLLLIDLAVILICMYSDLPVQTLLLIYLTIIWLNRSVLIYTSLFSVTADLALCLLSVGIAYSLFLSGNNLISILWCLLLIQTLHCLIPGARQVIKTQQASDNFEHNLQTAENALQRLLNQQ